MSGTCSAVLLKHALPDPVSLLQNFDQSGQGGVIVGAGQLTGGQRRKVLQQGAYNGRHI